MSAVRTALFVLRTVAAVGLVIGAASARVVYAGEKEIALSTDALRAGDPHGATEHARRAAGWYFPGAPHVRVAYERLFALASAEEGLGDRDGALYAFRAVRTASIETRWLVTPHEEDRARADRAIARIEAEAPRPPGMRTVPRATVEREALEALSRDDAPRTLWVVALVGGALAWAIGATWVVRRAVGATGILDVGRAMPGLVLGASGIVVWLLALWRA